MSKTKQAEKMQIEKWYKPKEAAEILGVSERSIFRYLKAKQLKGYQINTHWRITESNIKEFLEEQKRNSQ